MTPQRWDGGSARPGPPGAFLLWPAIYFVTVASLLLGLYATSVPGWDFGLALVAGCTCVAIAGFWAFSFATTINNARGRLPDSVLLRWVGIPLMGYLSLALVFFNVPATFRFELSRPAMEAAAQSNSGSSLQSGWIGLMPVGQVRVDADGTTIFLVSSSTFGDGACGYAYNPERTPVDEADGLGSPLDPGWWTWCDPWMD